MAYQPFYIAGAKSGLVKNPSSFLIPEDAFPQLEDAYIWRDKIKRKQGYDLLGRIQRNLTSVALTNTDGTGTYSELDLLSASHPSQTNATLKPGTVVIVIDPGGANETIYNDATTNGVLTHISGPFTGSGTISYGDGAPPTSPATITFTAAPGVGVTVTANYSYFPGLPVMGIGNRELSSLNLEELIVFDTIFSYRYNTSTNEFEEWITGTTWGGTNSDFFWTLTYWQDTSQRDLFWATNFTTTDPLRYANGVTWTDFAPAVGATCIDDENLGNITTPWMAFGPANLTNTPVKEGSVVVTVGVKGEDAITVLNDDSAGNLSSVTSGRSDTGTINYSTGALSLTINPALTADAAVHVEYCYLGELLQQCLALIPYKDRLLAFNTYEGFTLGGAVQFPQRLRYSQNGDPTDQFDGWRSDIPGRGGFIDAPTSEHIVSVAFIRDILIVSTERSTWQIRYTGNEVLPFVWEKIDTEYGCESTFSTVQFDRGVLQIGRDALTVCNGNHVERIDLQIPDEVGSFVSANEGNKRVHGIRDMNIQLVYWTFNSNGDKTFPNKLLVYNYVTNTFSIWNDHFTALGRWYRDRVIRWQDLTVEWESWIHPWNWAFRQQNFPEIIGGNQDGYVEIFNQTTYNDVSLFILDLTGTTTCTVSSPNHNLVDGQIVRLRNIVGDSGNTDLNDEFFKVYEALDDDFKILKYENGSFVQVSPGSSYLGGGEIEVCNNFMILSKQFNIFEAGQRVMVGYIDFLADRTDAGQFTCQIYVDSNSSIPINTDAEGTGTDSTNFFNSIIETSQPEFEIQGASRYWHRFYCPTDGTVFQYKLSLSDEQMVNPEVYQAGLTIYALILWMTPGPRLIGG
jgi:hypothetical protein